MNCQDVQEHLADYLGGELDTQVTQGFERHLQDCDACRKDVVSLTDTLTCLNRLETPPLAAPHRPFRSIGRLRGLLSGPGEARQKSSLYPFSERGYARWRQPLSYAAVLLIGLTIGWFAKPDPPSAAPHPGWIAAAVTSSSGDDDAPFARNTLRLVRAFAARR